MAHEVKDLKKKVVYSKNEKELWGGTEKHDFISENVYRW